MATELTGKSKEEILDNIYNTLGSGSKIILKSTNYYDENEIEVIISPTRVITEFQKYERKYEKEDYKKVYKDDGKYQERWSGKMYDRERFAVWEYEVKSKVGDGILGDYLHKARNDKRIKYPDLSSASLYRSIDSLYDKDNNEWRLRAKANGENLVEFECESTLQYGGSKFDISFTWDVLIPDDLPAHEFVKSPQGRVIHFLAQENDFLSIGAVSTKVEFLEKVQMYRIEAVPTEETMERWGDRYEYKKKKWKDLESWRFVPPPTMPPVIIIDVAKEDAETLFSKKYFDDEPMGYVKPSVKGWLSYSITKL